MRAEYSYMSTLNQSLMIHNSTGQDLFYLDNDEWECLCVNCDGCLDVHYSGVKADYLLFVNGVLTETLIFYKDFTL